MHGGLLEAWSVLLGITGIPGIPMPVLKGHVFPNTIRPSSVIASGEGEYSAHRMYVQDRRFTHRGSTQQP
jgi:hypothetical protein